MVCLYKSKKKINKKNGANKSIGVLYIILIEHGQ